MRFRIQHARLLNNINIRSHLSQVDNTACFVIWICMIITPPSVMPLLTLVLCLCFNLVMENFRSIMFNTQFEHLTHVRVYIFVCVSSLVLFEHQCSCSLNTGVLKCKLVVWTILKLSLFKYFLWTGLVSCSKGVRMLNAVPCNLLCPVLQIAFACH